MDLLSSPSSSSSSLSGGSLEVAVLLREDETGDFREATQIEKI